MFDWKKHWWLVALGVGAGTLYVWRWRRDRYRAEVARAVDRLRPLPRRT